MIATPVLIHVHLSLLLCEAPQGSTTTDGVLYQVSNIIIICYTTGSHCCWEIEIFTQFYNDVHFLGIHPTNIAPAAHERATRG